MEGLEVGLGARAGVRGARLFRFQAGDFAEIARYPTEEELR